MMSAGPSELKCKATSSLSFVLAGKRLKSDYEKGDSHEQN